MREAMFALLTSCWFGFLIGLRHALDPDHLAAISTVIVGVVHGLAGTGAITALALASMPSVKAALAYIGLFAIGSIAGMALLTGVAGVPIERLVRRPAAHAAVMAGVGAVSLLVGIVWGVPVFFRLLPS